MIKRALGRKPVKRRVFIVDDHEVVREGLAMVINQQPDMVACGRAEDARTAMDAVAKSHPDVVVIDLLLQSSDGLELIKDLRAVHRDLPMVVLSLRDERLFAERALRAGARGYVMKRAPTQELLTALRQVLNGRIYVSDGVASELALQAIGKHAARSGSSSVEQLSDRELEVFQLLGEGLSTKSIAQQLRLSMKTVSCYRQNIKHKLQLRDSNELIRRAVHWAGNLQAD